MPIKNLILAIALGTAMAVGIWTALSLVPEPATPETATVLPAAGPVPSFTLLDQNGSTVDESVFKGQWDVVFFGFAHCPDVCPITLGVLAAANRELGGLGETAPRIVLVSVDPERDTPESLKQYMASFGEGNLGLTGDIDQIRTLTDGLGVFFEKRDADEQGYYVVDHSSVVIVIDPEGRFHAIFSSPHQIKNFVRDLPILMSS